MVLRVTDSAGDRLEAGCDRVVDGPAVAAVVIGCAVFGVDELEALRCIGVVEAAVDAAGVLAVVDE